MAFDPIPLSEIEAARQRIAGTALRTPLVPLNADGLDAEVYLKLESLQPIGSFKIRGAANAFGLADPDTLRNGVWTASAGNMAQGVAWCARQAGVRCDVVVPDTAPETKLGAIRRLRATPIPVPAEVWFETFVTRQYPGLDGLMVHPFSDAAVMAGNGTIGLEILEDLPDVDTVLVPYGGGGLISGIASALKAARPSVRVLACEVETAAPLTPSLEAGRPVEVTYTPTFVDGIGAPRVFPEMFDLVRRLVEGSLVSSVEEIAAAVRLLAERNRVVAEGAGAASVAPVLAGRAGGSKVVCVVSGGNIDGAKLATILSGDVP
jgi:threonine dehydratase